MKNFNRLLVMVLVLVFVLTAMCACTPPDTEPDEPNNGEHVHDFVLRSETPATCTTDAVKTYKCSCGQLKRETVEDSALGHDISDTVSSISRLYVCTREGCSYAQPLNVETDYIDNIVYTFTSDDETRINEKHTVLVDWLNSLGTYDATQHALDEANPNYQDLYTKNEKLNTDWDAYVAEIEFVVGQYQYARILSDIKSTDSTRADNFEKISTYYDKVLGDYNSTFQEIYDSPLREFAFEGMTEQEIKELLAEAGSYSNERYVQLSTRNSEIVAEYRTIDPGDAKMLTLYEEFVRNNNEIAIIVGRDQETDTNKYANYMGYAYDVVYSREYTIEAASQIYSNVLQYITPLISTWYSQQSSHSSSNLPKEQKEIFNQISSGSFFSDKWANVTVNDFLETITLTRGETTFTFAEKMQDVIRTGNYFTGTNGSAYTWYIQELNSPIMFFGKGYQNANTVIHEFGHYINSLINYNFDQSFDLNETHSQGLEMLYSNYLRSVLKENCFDALYAESIYNALNTICLTIAVDRFEHAVYSNTYTGKNADEIMADGKISKGEYDKLFTSILDEVGLGGLVREDYWRYVVVESAGYYISYAVSLLGSLQLLSTEADYSDKVESYLYLLTYTEGWTENAAGEIVDAEGNLVSEKTYKELLVEAGLYAYDDPELFEYLNTILAV